MIGRRIVAELVAALVFVGALALIGWIVWHVPDIMNWLYPDDRPAPDPEWGG